MRQAPGLHHINLQHPHAPQVQDLQGTRRLPRQEGEHQPGGTDGFVHY
jgi:hypothetical protein